VPPPGTSNKAKLSRISCRLIANHPERVCLSMRNSSQRFIALTSMSHMRTSPNGLATMRPKITISPRMPPRTRKATTRNSRTTRRYTFLLASKSSRRMKSSGSDPKSIFEKLLTTTSFSAAKWSASFLTVRRRILESNQCFLSRISLHMTTLRILLLLSSCKKMSLPLTGMS
jgi:hypothetical protein